MDENRHPDFSPVKRAFIVTALACALACEGSAAFTQIGAIMIAIDKMAVGTAPADFEFARTGQGEPGRWVIVADATAAGGRAIEQVSTEPTDNRFPLAIVNAGDIMHRLAGEKLHQ